MVATCYLFHVFTRRMDKLVQSVGSLAARYTSVMSAAQECCGCAGLVVLVWCLRSVATSQGDNVAGAATTCAPSKDAVDQIVADTEPDPMDDGAARSAAKETSQHAATARYRRLLRHRLRVSRRCSGLHVVVDHRMDRLQQQRRLVLLLLDVEGDLFEVQQPLPRVRVTGRRGGL